MNVPKFLSPDLPLFSGIMSDLFPGIGRPNVDYGDLQTAISTSAQAAKLQPVPNFVTKCIQVYETVVVRHGMMVVGPTGGGKSSMIRTTAAALSSLAAADKQGPKIDKVLTHTLNPKSITMDQVRGRRLLVQTRLLGALLRGGPHHRRMFPAAERAVACAVVRRLRPQHARVD